VSPYTKKHEVQVQIVTNMLKTLYHAKTKIINCWKKYKKKKKCGLLQCLVALNESMTHFGFLKGVTAGKNH
jgi:hypothetical protein